MSLLKYKTKIENDFKPKIIPSKKERKTSPYSHFYFTKVERQVLWNKYIRNGYSYDDAKRKLNKDIDWMDDFIMNLKLKNKKLKEEDINQKFKEEFAKLCMQAER